MTGCRRFEALLEDWVAGTLDGDARRAAETHLASCPDCHELCQLARLTDDSPDLTAAVLAATIGTACARAEESLPAYLEAGLANPDHHLVASHLESCPACRRLAEVIATMEATLPRLAELPVPATFTQDVLATLGALRRQSASPARKPVELFDARLSRWWRVTWPRLIWRPRFATEIAYALTVVAVLAVQMTGTFAGAEPRELLDRAREETVEQVQALAEAPVVGGAAVTVYRLGDRFAELYRTFLRTTGTFLHESASSLQNPDESDASEPTKETP